MASISTKRVINTDDWREVAFFGVGGICALVIVLCVTWLVIGIATSESDSKQIVSGPVTLSAQWTEFAPPKSLRALKDSQEIVLDVDPSEGLVEDNLHLEQMRLSNGVLLHPQIQLVDSAGNILNASVNRYPVPSLYKNGLSGQLADLPQDRTFTKVRVRSDAPVRLSRIVWHCHQYK